MGAGGPSLPWPTRGPNVRNRPAHLWAPYICIYGGQALRGVPASGVSGRPAEGVPVLRVTQPLRYAGQRAAMGMSGGVQKAGRRGLKAASPSASSSAPRRRVANTAVPTRAGSRAARREVQRRGLRPHEPQGSPPCGAAPHAAQPTHAGQPDGSLGGASVREPRRKGSYKRAHRRQLTRWARARSPCRAPSAGASGPPTCHPQHGPTGPAWEAWGLHAPLGASPGRRSSRGCTEGGGKWGACLATATALRGRLRGAPPPRPAHPPPPCGDGARGPRRGEFALRRLAGASTGDACLDRPGHPWWHSGAVAGGGVPGHPGQPIRPHLVGTGQGARTGVVCMPTVPRGPLAIWRGPVPGDVFSSPP